MISGLVGFPERVFVPIALGTGLLVLALVPPFKGADERAHFLRTYQVSEGTILPEKTPDGVGGFLPGRLKARASPVSTPDRTFLDFRNTALYSPVPYLPQATIIGMGRVLDLPPGTLLYLGRLAGLITAVALTFLAIRTAPIGKRLFLLLALTPMAVRQMALLTADSVTNASAFLLIAIFLRLSLDPGMRLQGGVLVLLVLCSLVVVLSKQTYFPLLALYLLCPVTKAGSRRRYAAIFLIVAGGGLALLAAWSLAIRPLYLPQHIAPGADPGRQLAVILADPIRSALLLLADLRHDPFRYLGGGRLAYAPRALRGAALAAIALVVALLDGGGRGALDLGAKGLLLAVFASTLVLVETLAYLAWNPVGAETISFVQGRYFIAVGPLVFLPFSNRRTGSIAPGPRFTLLVACFAVFSSILTIRGILRVFHGG